MCQFGLDKGISQQLETRMNKPAGTQNPVVRKHRVGSSPTSGTAKLPANRHFSLRQRKAPGIHAGGFGSNAAAIGYERASSTAAAAWSRMFGST
jgi:hypothetical protein